MYVEYLKFSEISVAIFPELSFKYVVVTNLTLIHVESECKLLHSNTFVMSKPEDRDRSCPGNVVC
jgi:hypothetical protein